jgi:hypothetical protein
MATGGFQPPRKISIRTNSCVLCGFSFIETEITSSGERIVHKRFTQKVKLNPEKISIICDVISNFQLDPDIDKDNRVLNVLERSKMQSSIRRTQTRDMYM